MSEYKGYTEKIKESNIKYQKKNMEQVSFWVKKGEREKYKQQAEAHGMSLRAYILYLLDNDK